MLRASTTSSAWTSAPPRRARDHRRRKIIAIDLIADPETINQLDVMVLGD